MKKIAYTFIVVLCSISMVAEANNGHVIVAFDRFTGFNSKYAEKSTLYSIDSLIKRDLDFDKLYLSVVGYAMNSSNPDIDKFVIPYTDSAGNPILWYNYESLVKLFPQWPEGQPTGLQYYENPGSMQSLSKPYCVMETAVWKNNQQAEATYVLFVTDDKVQGVDDNYAAEWKQMYSYNPSGYKRIERQVFQRLQRFNEMYRFEIQSRVTLQNKYDKKYEVIVYKLLPASNPSIYSVSDMPSPLPIKRVRGGYMIDCKVQSKDAHYKVCDWTVIGADGNAFERNRDGNLFVRSSKLKDGDTIEIRMQLQQTDSLYGGVLLNESNCTGMALCQPVKINNESKIWGVIPLSDFFWWWMPNDVEAAVEIWEYIIFILFICLLAYIYRTLSKHLGLYRPSNRKISMSIRTSK